MVDLLSVSDRTPGDLREITGMEWNLLGFHLGVLEASGIVERRRSEGDGRRRYVRLVPGVVRYLPPLAAGPAVRFPLFVCTRNSARSQFAAAFWQKATALPAVSAGSHPADSVDRLARTVAATYGLDLSGCRPRGYDEISEDPDAVISVCDRALEGGLPMADSYRHWSVPDPAVRSRKAFQLAFAEIAERVERLAKVSA
jgi:protein-tyrosine-phosphatase